jgi:predicted enzyme related to lactoylglutathione lyase
MTAMDITTTTPGVNMTGSSTQGIKTVEPAHDVGGGRLVATVSDPDGNVLGLLQDR